MKSKLYVMNIVAIIALILSIFSGVTMIGCSGGDGGGGNATEWDIPVMTITSGYLAGPFSEGWWALQEMRDYVNSHGGIAGKPIKLTLYPCGSDVASAVSAAGAIIDKRPLIALLWVGPDQLAAIEPAFYGANITSFVASTTKPVYTSYNKTMVALKTGDYGFIVGGPALWVNDNNVTNNVTIQNVAVVYDTAGQSTWATLANQAAASLNSTGVNATVMSFSSTGVVDWTSIVTPWLSAGYDGYVPIATYLGAKGMFNKMYELGFNDSRRFMFTFTSSQNEFWLVATNNATGAYFEIPFNPTYNGTLWQSTWAASKAARGVEPYINLEWSSNAIFMLKAAIESSGITGNTANVTTERPQLLNAWRNLTEVDGIAGPINMYQGFCAMNNFLLEAAGNETLVTSRLVGTSNYSALQCYTYYHS